MNKLEKYTDQEWQLISCTPQLVGMAMAGAASSGLVGSTKEMIANAKSFLKAKDRFRSNELIQAILPNTSSTSKAMADSKLQSTVIKAKLKEHQIKSGEQMAGFVLEDCASALAVMEEKDPDAVSDYKNWLLDIAKNTANAGKEGDFLGIGGTRFSEKEKVFYEKLKKTLD